MVYLPNPYLVFLLQVILSTAVILITAEFIPKMIFKNNANKVLVNSAPLIGFFYLLLFIPSYIITSFSNLIIRLTSDQNNKQENVPTFGMVDLDHYLQEQTINSSHEDLEHEVLIFKNARDFSGVKARECMIPRTDILAIDVNDSTSDIQKLFIDTGHSKILVYRESIDNIIGYVHHFELFKKQKSIKNMLLPIFVVPEAMSGSDVLTQFIQKQKSVAIVVDELGGTSGMLTLEDVVEEIIGEIEDEHDNEDYTEEKISETEYLFSARLEIDYINETYDLGIPSYEGVETLGGTVLEITESIPSEGEIIVLEGFELEVKKVEGNRVELIRVLRVSD